MDTAPQEELRAIQSEKLRVAVRYAYECVPFYRRKFDRIGLKPGDIRSVVDLPLIPVTTKQDILACTPSYAPYLAGVMRELGLDPAASSLRYLFCAGEPGFSIPSTRRRLEETWQRERLFSYSQSNRRVYDS